jgi:hypothetical protein
MTVLEHYRYGGIPRNSLGRLPRIFTGARSADVLDAVDRAAAAVLRPLTQNHVFVATPGAVDTD